jgi:hypothetical protein
LPNAESQKVTIESPPRRVAREIFENQKIGGQSSAHDPLPTGHLNEKTGPKIDHDWSPEKRKKEGSTSFRQAFRIGV